LSRLFVGSPIILCPLVWCSHAAVGRYVHCVLIRQGNFVNILMFTFW
jgi:hypothetical protein